VFLSYSHVHTLPSTQTWNLCSYTVVDVVLIGL